MRVVLSYLFIMVGLHNPHPYPVLTDCKVNSLFGHRARVEMRSLLSALQNSGHPLF